MVTDTLKSQVIQQAVGTGEYGARDLKNMIQQYIVAKTAEHRASGSVVPTTEILLDYEDGDVVVYEGYDVPPRQALQLPQESSTPLLPVERIQMDIDHGKPFTLNMPDTESSQDRTSYQVELKKDDKLHGIVRIKQVNVTNVENAVVYPSGKLYTFQLELHGVNRQHPRAITMKLNNDVFVAQPVFQSRKTSGRAPYQQIKGWQQKGSPNDLVEFALSWQDIKKAEFIITDETE